MVDRAHRPDITSSASSAGGDNGPISDSRVGTYFLGRYRVVDEIGLGGMASVHLARMDGLGGFQKWVAIKKIHSHLVQDESFIQMFLDEARIAARISHPNVATVFEVGQHERTYWIAMEYLHGEPLREVMRRTEELGAPMPPEIACRVIADAAEGLHSAHELLGKNGEQLQVVHRDVTPHNLFVTYDGTTKVVDFGIAKFASRMSSTLAGTLKGKLAYMSPEQVHGEALDRRTDIFALGVVLWELTTGQRLFRMESDLDTLAKVQECAVPRPSSLVRGYPIDLEKIVMKALAKNRGERFKTARELSRALQSLLMRRGLFIASDEVAAYVQSIFTERIQKREAHLRWAAEVTKTLSVDSLGEAGDAPASSSELRLPAAGRPAPRPAAGTPAVEPSSHKPAHGGNGRHAGPGRRDASAHRPPPSVSASTESSPDDTLRRGRGGSITADAPTGESVAFDVGSYEDGPTIQGNSPEFGYDEDDDDEGDQDETLVTSSPEEGEALRMRMLPAPTPAAGRPFKETQEMGVASSTATRPRPAPYEPMPAPPMPMPMEVPPTQPLVVPGSNTLPPMPSNAPNPFLGPMGMAPAHPSSPGIALSHPPPFVPAGRENRTVAARALKRGIPMWAVALASGLVALLFVGAIYLLIAGPADANDKRPTPMASGGAAPDGATKPSGGPFAAARSAFKVALLPQPTDAKAPGQP